MDINLKNDIDKMMGFQNRTLVTEPKPEIHLSDIQTEIVESEEPRIVIAAGAGSGKTRVLIERIKYLLSVKEVEPNNIVAITFTNMAADEMKERLADVDGIGDAFIGTIHSFANKVFQNSDEKYTIYSDETDNELHKYLINRYCKHISFEKYLLFKDKKSKFSMGLIGEDELREFLLPSERHELAMISRMSGTPEYPETIKSICRQRCIITFDDLLKKASEYFKSLNAEIEYVLVDEFQDVGTLEYEFIKSLNAKNLFLVGDDWQAIYGFKGGNVNLFLNLMKDKNFKQYYLNDNYRSGSSIVKLGMRIIEQVPNRITKRVKCSSGREGKTIVDSQQKLTKYLQTIKDAGDYGEWFILVRSNREVYQMTDKLMGMGIPCSTFKRSEMSLSELREAMNQNTVKILTIHTSKGLESPKVLVTGRFPINEPSYRRNPEERKVLYVAITRAIDVLVLLN